MIRFLVPAFGLLLTAGLIGCQKDTMATDDPAMPVSADACTHCAGAQVATAEGKCPSCGARVGR